MTTKIKTPTAANLSSFDSRESDAAASPSDQRTPSQRAAAVVQSIDGQLATAQAQQQSTQQRLDLLHAEEVEEQTTLEALVAQRASLRDQVETQRTAVSMYTDTPFADKETQRLTLLEVEAEQSTSALNRWQAQVLTQQVEREQARDALAAELQAISQQLPRLEEQRRMAVQVARRTHAAEGEAALATLLEPLAQVRASYEEALAVARAREVSMHTVEERIRRQADTVLKSWPRLRQQAINEADDAETRGNRAADENLRRQLGQQYFSSWAAEDATNGASEQARRRDYVPSMVTDGLLGEQQAARILSNAQVDRISATTRHIDQYQHQTLPDLVDAAQAAAAREQAAKDVAQQQAQEPAKDAATFAVEHVPAPAKPWMSE
jgi:hypothetical protein